MAVHVTRCPHCQTTFRVRDEHLSAANGMVRCGSCLQVFKAAEFFITQTQPEVPARTSTTAPQHKSKKQDNLDFGLIHDDMDEDTKETNEVFSDDPAADFNLRAPDKLSRPKPNNDVIDFGDITFDLDNDNDSSFQSFGADKEESADEDESWAKSLLEDTPTKGNDAYLADTEPDNYFESFDELDATPVDSTANLVVEKTSLSAKVADLKLLDDPLELTTKSKKKLPWLWLLGSCLLIISCAAQVLYFNFSDLSRTPKWRPMYAQICQVFECQLPKIQDTSKMVNQLFTVKSHPHYQGALLVETLLLNRANYAQPFPDILLTFKDLNERSIAYRRFTPSQYLSGEMAGQTEMPEQTPIHIALEIVDPGVEAVSFTINLLANH